MKKITNNGTTKFAASATDKSKAMAHARRLAREKTYDGYIEVYFANDIGEFMYYEFVGDGDYVQRNPTLEYIGTARCSSF